MSIYVSIHWLYLGGYLYVYLCVYLCGYIWVSIYKIYLKKTFINVYL